MSARQPPRRPQRTTAGGFGGGKPFGGDFQLGNGWAAQEMSDDQYAQNQLPAARVDLAKLKVQTLRKYTKQYEVQGVHPTSSKEDIAKAVTEHWNSVQITEEAVLQNLLKTPASRVGLRRPAPRGLLVRASAAAVEGERDSSTSRRPGAAGGPTAATGRRSSEAANIVPAAAVLGAGLAGHAFSSGVSSDGVPVAAPPAGDRPPAVSLPPSSAIDPLLSSGEEELEGENALALASVSQDELELAVHAAFEHEIEQINQAVHTAFEQELENINHTVEQAVETAMLDRSFDVRANLNTLIALTGVILYWRGVWNLADAWLGTSDLASNLASLGIGLSVMLIFRVLKLPLAEFW